MGIPKPKLRTHNIVFVPVGSGVQEWHVDDSMIQKKLHRYLTILIRFNTSNIYLLLYKCIYIYMYFTILIRFLFKYIQYILIILYINTYVFYYSN